MDDLINRQDAINLLKKWSDGYEYIEIETELAIKEFKYLPSATAPVKRGRWLINKEDGWITIAPCSVCGGTQDVDFPYCPNCGAKMEVEE